MNTRKQPEAPLIAFARGFRKTAQNCFLWEPQLSERWPMKFCHAPKRQACLCSQPYRAGTTRRPCRVVGLSLDRFRQT
jgi:hypothetical protein